MASPDQPGASSSSGIQGATSAVSNMAQQASERVREQASHAVGQAQEHAQAFLSEQKVVAADHIEGVARVLHDTVDQLRQRSPGAVTDYAELAVGSLDSVASALREQDVRSLVGQVEDFARRQPVLFVAGSVAIGFALARFLKSSSRAGYGQGSTGQFGSSGQRHGSGPSGAYRSSAPGSTGSRSATEFSRHMNTEGQVHGTRTSASTAGNGSGRGQRPTESG
jgi:hypothetical protein